jgi:hypothetical protein
MGLREGLSVVASAVGLAACALVSGAADLEVAPEAPPDAAGTPDSAADTGPLPETGPLPCTKRSHGPRFPEVVTGNWSSPANARVDDGRIAHGREDLGALRASGFGFAIPAGARIDGIVVQIARSTIGDTRDDAVALAKGTSKAIPGPWFLDLPETNHPKVAFGDESDLWGASWTPADINAQDGFTVTQTVLGNGDCHIDSFAVTVHTCE